MASEASATAQCCHELLRAVGSLPLAPLGQPGASPQPRGAAHLCPHSWDSCQCFCVGLPDLDSSLRLIAALRAGGCRHDSISPAHTRAAFILVFFKRRMSFPS